MSSKSNPAETRVLSKPAHSLNVITIIKELETDQEHGLSSEEATRRLSRYGPNELDDGPGVQPFKILLRQVANAMMLVSAR